MSCQYTNCLPDCQISYQVGRAAASNGIDYHWDIIDYRSTNLLKVLK